jgi:hypothetical protein
MQYICDLIDENLFLGEYPDSPGLQGISGGLRLTSDAKKKIEGQVMPTGLIKTGGFRKNLEVSFT